MANYRITITKTWCVNVQANTEEEAEDFVRNDCEPEWEDNAVESSIEFETDVWDDSLEVKYLDRNWQ
jgi:hypothetical protein